MADSSAPEPPTEQVKDLKVEETAKLLKDEVTGEMVSKTELKKRQKAREREAAKAAKAAAAPPKPAAAKKGNAEADEKNLDPSQYFENRSRAINKCVFLMEVKRREKVVAWAYNMISGCARPSLPTLTPTSSTVRSADTIIPRPLY